jgi:hypothetical protein
MTSLSPFAPALTQAVASSLICSTRLRMEGRARSKTQSFRCFQIIHGVRRATVASPFRIGFGVSFALSHQSCNVSSDGTVQGMRSQARTSCQICREKGHSVKRWPNVSGCWSRRRHLGWCCSPLLASLSAVQQRSRFAIQWKNLTRGGAQASKCVAMLCSLSSLGRRPSRLI